MNKRGKKTAPQMGSFLLEKELIPQTILCSTALRAKQTAEAVAEKCGYKEDVSYLDSLYMAEADEIIKTIRHTSDDFERILVIGHNPGLESMIPLLCHRIESLPTGAIAYFTLPIDRWKDLSKHTEAELIEVWRPKELE